MAGRFYLITTEVPDINQERLYHFRRVQLTALFRRRNIWILCLLLSTVLSGRVIAQDAHTQQSKNMLEKQIVSRGVKDPRVLEAMRVVPRHLFVPPTLAGRAYDDSALPIEEGQTISQPYIVALMTELLNTSPGDSVLEIGTGSGYQAAVLSRLVKQVYSIEILPALAESARNRLRELGFANVAVRTGDGYLGWPELAPFDGILVTAAPLEIPSALVAQLKRGGRMVLPVGPTSDDQELLVIEKSATSDSITQRTVIPVRFVPMVHRADSSRN